MSCCKNCGSYAINPRHHGRREGADEHLCDVCYWRKRAEVLAAVTTELIEYLSEICETQEETEMLASAKQEVQNCRSWT